MVSTLHVQSIFLTCFNMHNTVPTVSVYYLSLWRPSVLTGRQGRQSLCSPPARCPPSIGVFPSESALHIRWPNYWSFNFIISPSNEYSGLISFRMDWFDLLEVQGTLKSPLQHHNLNASVLQCSACFMVQLSHPYMTTGKTINSTTLSIRVPPLWPHLT